MILRKVDDKGYFVEDVLVDIYPTVLEVTQDAEGNEITTEVRDTSYIDTPCTEGLYKPKWTGANWVEGLTKKQLDEIKNQPHTPTDNEKIWDVLTYLLVGDYQPQE
jgi:hypothetical protein